MITTHIRLGYNFFYYSRYCQIFSALLAVGFVVGVTVFPYVVAENLKSYNGSLLRTAMMGMVVCILSALGFVMKNPILKFITFPPIGWAVLMWYSYEHTSIDAI